MDAIITAFGIDGRLIIIQLVNFAILMGALGYFLYNPILNALKAREEKIAAGIADAEAAAIARANAESEKKDILTAAHLTAEEIAARAKVAAAEQADGIVTEAETKAAATIKSAEAAAEQLRLKIAKEAEAEIAKTAILAAEKVLRERSAEHCMTHNYVQAVIANLETGMSPDVVLHNLKAVLDRRGHTRLYGAIVRSVLSTLEMRAAATATTVTVAKSVDATGPLVATLIKELGASDENIVTKIDESIIGGAKVSYQSRHIDATYKQSLYSLYQAITK